MKIRLLSDIILILTTLSFFPGCTKHYDVADPEKEAFNFMVTEAQRLYINDSRKIQYEITDPIPELHFAGEVYPVDRFEIRGDNTLNFNRKSFGINMDRKITFFCPEEQRLKYYEEFKMLAMVYDYTYIENSTAMGLFKKTGLWPVHSFFTEVRLNGHTQGLYFFIEDPFEFFMEQKNSSCVIRRGYNHVIKANSVSPEAPHSETYYFSRFRKIYTNLPVYSGLQMYDTLSAYIDLEEYFTKLSIDMLIKNGDYTDEVIFYTKIRDNKEVFGIFPWDLDDIFADQPHEIGNDWAPGTIFGTRAYFSMDDVTADVGNVLIYSIEDDLDYKIAKDSYLYQKYLKTLRSVIEKIDPAVIDRIFDYTFDHVGAFYATDSIIAQSQYDHDETDYDLFTANIADKRRMLKERRNWILQELNNQQDQ